MSVLTSQRSLTIGVAILGFFIGCMAFAENTDLQPLGGPLCVNEVLQSNVAAVEYGIAVGRYAVVAKVGTQQEKMDALAQVNQTQPLYTEARTKATFCLLQAANQKVQSNQKIQ